MATGLKHPLFRLTADVALSATNEHLSGRFKSTAEVFYRGVMRGLSIEILNPEAAIFLSGQRESAGVFLEGAAMGATIADHVMPWRNDRWKRLAEASSSKHPYEIHTGFGMALAILGRKADHILKRKHFDSLWDWFTIDGFAFQTGLMNSDRCLRQQWRPLEKHLTPYGWRVFDQGLGRSMWFTLGGDTAEIVNILRAFPKERRRDLLIGLGVAAAHTGGVSQESLKKLRNSAGNQRRYLAVGAAVAAHVRRLAGTRSSVTDESCIILSGLSSESAADLVQWSQEQIGAEKCHNAHEQWQGRLIAAMKA